MKHSIPEYFATHQTEYLQMVLAHMRISLIAVLVAVVIAVPVGILGARYQKFGRFSEGLWGTLRLIPSLAILIFLIPFMGTGVKPAVTALVLLAIPPVLINTILGFQSVPEPVLEAGRAMGMTPARLFLKVKAPLAFPVVFAGIRTAAVEVIASATLACYIGAGGLGNLIFTGLGLMREDLLWIGGFSVALLSLGTGFLLSLVDKYIRRYERT